MESGGPSVTSQPTGRRKLPTWARVIVALVLAVLVGLTYGAFRLADVIEKVAREAIDPAKIPEIAKQIGDFPNPLPAGYKYEYALGFPQITVSIRHQPDNQLIQLLCDKNSFEEDPKVILDRALDLGGQGLPAKIHGLKSKGKEMILGQDMPYIVGEFYDEDHRNVEGMIGCISIKNAHKTILIYALAPFGSPYTLQVTMDLLKSIKHF
jgi:hypothetical protein